MPESTGALTEAVFYILLSLYQPLHGYGIMQKVETFSSGRVVMGAGTLYGAINTLVEKGLITPLKGDVDSRKKEYVITQAGRYAVEAELRRLEELVGNGTRIIRGSF